MTRDGRGGSFFGREIQRGEKADLAQTFFSSSEGPSSLLDFRKTFLLTDELGLPLFCVSLSACLHFPFWKIGKRCRLPLIDLL